MSSGVYQFICVVTGARYIGSSVDVAARRYHHLCDLRRGRHANPKFQACWNKYGEASFKFEILEEVDPSKLMAAEQAWLDIERPELNVNPNADAPMRGVRMSEEHKAKISAAGKGHPVSAETRALIAARNKGNRSALGCKRSGEFRERLRARMTPELKAKLARAASEARARRAV